MKIEYLHASKYGNGAIVAEEFKRLMSSGGDNRVDVHHVRDADPKRLPPADLYVFSSPGRFGKPIGTARRFLKKVQLPAGTEFAILTTEFDPQAGEAQASAPQEPGPCQQVGRIMDELLAPKHLTKVADATVHVTGLKGPLEAGWKDTVEEFAATISSRVDR